ncbi:hypothetical protein [Teredinibacter sp. KSP-S5-2]|uniref:hypothetical protein n=1 Tax=Teredinibacter sp. KSP-S5-2 TaxID=3034506 RepID=UPI002934537F|nr:hypothetical protein [Teredinibacter sp. KSP-S5-2]WNO10077.1 hypothetical protein P5V12_02715 [Teredinibacter sp. KSP-S5-2]
MRYFLLLIILFSSVSYSDSRERLVALESCSEFSRTFQVAENEKFEGGQSYISREFEFYGVDSQAILTCKEGVSNSLFIIAKHSEFASAKYHFEVIYNELKHLYGAESAKASTILAVFENNINPPSKKGFDSIDYEKQWEKHGENKLSLNKYRDFYAIVYGYVIR